MANVLQQVDERTKLAGTNKLEVLLFSLGVDERTGRGAPSGRRWKGPVGRDGGR